MHKHWVQCPQKLIHVSILFKMNIGQIMAISIDPGYTGSISYVLTVILVCGNRIGAEGRGGFI